VVLGEQAASAFQLTVHSKVIAIHDQILGDGGGCVNVDVGIFHSCEEFVQKAKQLSHPFDGSSALDDDVLVAIFELFTLGLEHLQLKRELALNHYENLAKELESEEEELHAAMRPEREWVIQKKKVLLYKKMCEDAGIECSGLVDSMVNGSQVMKAAKWKRKEIMMSRNAESSDPELDEKVWAASKAERGGG
jgi:hypothetical protein